METFDRIRMVAYQMAGYRPESSQRARAQWLERPKPPRLTEAWFCCAEPTAGQFKLLEMKGHGEV